MKQKIIRLLSLVLCVMSIVSLSSVGASAASQNKINFPTGVGNVSIYYGGKRALEGQAAIIDSVTYVGIRAFCDLVGEYDISWNASTRTARVSSGGLSLSATSGDVYIYANGRCFYSVKPIRIIDDRICVPIRPLAKALGIEVSWDASTRSVILTRTGRTLTSGDRFYDSDDLYWLSRIISAEAKGEPLVGQIAVGNVVLNRVRSRSYPNTVYGVVFDRKNGTQFSPVAIGTIYKAPTASAIIAAKICLEGYSISNDILFFMNPRIATNNWIAKNRKFEFKIGNHSFYS